MSRLRRTITVLPATDISRASDWYGRVLGLETVYLHEGTRAGEETNYAVLLRDGTQVHLILDEPAPYKNTWTQAGTGYLYAQVEDVEALLAEVRAAGAELSAELALAPWGVQGFELRDPDGNLVRVEQAQDANPDRTSEDER